LQDILKDKEYSNNPCNKDNLKEITQHTLFSISTAELLVCNWQHINCKPKETTSSMFIKDND